MSGAESFRAFGQDATNENDTSQIILLDKKLEGDELIFVSKNDSQLLIWAFSFSVEKLTEVLASMTSLCSDLAAKKNEDRRLLFGLFELTNLLQLRKNEDVQKTQLRQLIVINSTGRHRKNPSGMVSKSLV